MKKIVCIVSVFFVFNLTAQIPGNPHAGYEFTNGNLSNIYASGSGGALQPTSGGAPILLTFDRFGSSTNAAQITQPLNGFVTPNTNHFSTTLSFWIKHTGAGLVSSDQRILQAYNSNGYGYRVELGTNALWIYGKALQSNGSDLSEVVDVPAILDDNVWHHILIRTSRVNLHASNDAILFEVFIDNVKTDKYLQSPGGGPGTPSLSEFVNNANFKIRPTNNFTGALDDIYYYNSRISTANATAIFNDSPSAKISENVSNVKLSIYPNPTTNELHIDTDKVIKTIKLYNMVGQNVATFIATKSINVSALTNGIYMAKISLSDGKTVIRKFVKK